MGPRRIWCGDGWNRAASPNPWSGPLDAGIATRRCLKTRSGHWRASATSGTSPRPPASSAPSGCAHRWFGLGEGDRRHACESEEGRSLTRVLGA